MKYAIERPSGQGIRFVRDDGATFALIYQTPQYHLAKYVPYAMPPKTTACGLDIQFPAVSGNLYPDRTCVECLLQLFVGDDWKKMR